MRMHETSPVSLIGAKGFELEIW